MQIGGLTGWVRNRSDGSVEVLAMGEEQQLEALWQWLHKGPALAKVESVHQEKVEPEPLTDFAIRYDEG
jgi:acylphosphatase